MDRMKPLHLLPVTLPVTLAIALAMAFTAALPATAQAQLKIPLGSSKAGTGIKAAPAPSTAPAAGPATAPTASATSTSSEKEAAGQLAAAAWLTLLDRGSWGQAWDNASVLFRTAVPLAAWMDGAPKLREPLGPLQDRTPVDSVHKTVLAGHPDGNYVTSAFASKFANKADAQEIVTVALEADGKWRVTGYQTR